MSKRQFKSQASSSRAVSSAGFGGFGITSSGSTLSYLTEPPNLSTISDPNVVVAFKNLLKKDSTTKSKGLEDLRNYAQAHPYEQDGGVEDAILEAWVKLFPRISIDNSRRVRELSHNLQFELLKSARKRMEKHIPNIVGAWLAGTYDRDRPVSRAAIDGITSFLDNESKVLLFWRRCQLQILDYAQDAIEETPQSLSDERTVSADDSRAKYDRVIGSSLSLIVNILLKLAREDTQKYQDKYDSFLSGNYILWGFISSKDAFVRRTTAQLMQICLDKQGEIIEKDLELVSHAFIAEGLRASHSGSALQFLQALNRLTMKLPDAWTTAYKGKKTPLSRLQLFVEKGSQGGPPEYWQTLSHLLIRIPRGVLPSDFDGALSFLNALRDGISNREEVRSNAPAAWSSYLDIVKHFGTEMPTDTSNQLSQATVFPIFEQYLRPSSETSRWSMGNGTGTLSKAFSLCALSENTRYLVEEWQRLAEALVINMLTSLPEQSKDHKKSQDAIVAEAHRWFGLQAEILKSARASEARFTSTTELLKGASTTIVTSALDLIAKRQGKPYGAAGAIEVALRLAPELVSAAATTQQAVDSFFRTEFQKYVTSPSSTYLIASLYAIHLLPGQDDLFNYAWGSAMDQLLLAPATAQTIDAIRGLTASHSVSILARNDKKLQEFLFRQLSSVVDGKSQEWPLFESTITFDSLEAETAKKLLAIIVQSLDNNFSDENAPLRSLEFISLRKPHLLRDDDSMYLAVMTRLLALTETANSETVSRASLLKATIDGKNESAEQSSRGSSSLLAIIRESLETADLQSLAVDTLVQQAQSLLETRDEGTASSLLPRIDVWGKALHPLLECKPNPSLSLTNLLGGAASIVHPSSTEPQQRPTRDLNGYSVPLRMALYTVKLLPIIYQNLSAATQVDVLRILSLTVEVASDQLGLQEKNKLWSSLADPETEIEVQEFLSTAQKCITSLLGGATLWRDPSSQGQSAVVGKLVSELIGISRNDSASAYYASRALETVLSNLVELHGWQSSGGEEWLASLGVVKASTPDILTATAVLSGLKESLGSSKIVNTLCNRLISDVAGASPDKPKTLGLLVFMNACLAVYEPEELPVAHNRLVFAVKQITSWMETEDTIPPFVYAEAFRGLQYLLPSIKDVYGTYWETTIRACTTLWATEIQSGMLDTNLSALHASLRLMTILANLEEANDDLAEALVTSDETISHGLIHLLALPRTREHQPLRIFDELLGRQVSKAPLKHVKDMSTIYPLIASDFRLIQSAAFDILHRAIPAAQEQISVDVLLEDKDALLPEELLSLLLDAPSIQNLHEEALVEFPSTIRSYLLSWHLIFDSFTNAVPRVRSDYSDRLKTENVMTPLLNFMFDALGHSAGKSINLDRENFGPEMIRSYDLKVAESEPDERHMHWLLINLYYLSLTLAPNHVKNWWIDLRSKQTRIAVESWTERYFSPLVISDVLDEVSMWAEKQEVSDDEKELLIKISKRSREVFAGYEIDDMLSQLAVRLPPIYPLEGVKVESINRVAVSEKKWQSWLMITQGVITFSNGSLTDGLLAFRKNVSGAMKGQTECAICYSIVSADKRTPDKRCQTCKHLFHASCLFKWFSTSNQSTCPLCRNPFTFAGDVGRKMGPRRGGGAGGWEL